VKTFQSALTMREKLNEYDKFDSYILYNLGLCYYHGESALKRDYYEAYKCFKLSVESWYHQHSHQTTTSEDGTTTSSSSTVHPIHMTHSLLDPLQPRNQPNVNAIYSLAWCYRYGEGTAKNREEAVRLFTIAANHQHSKAQYQLAWCYWRGKGVKERNIEEAKKWFIASAKQGDIQAIRAMRSLDIDLPIEKEVEEDEETTTTTDNNNINNKDQETGKITDSTIIPEDNSNSTDPHTTVDSTNQQEQPQQQSHHVHFEDLRVMETPTTMMMSDAAAHEALEEIQQHTLLAAAAADDEASPVPIIPSLLDTIAHSTTEEQNEVELPEQQENDIL
jgi:TPR repeat protein